MGLQEDDGEQEGMIEEFDKHKRAMAQAMEQICDNRIHSCRMNVLFYFCFSIIQLWWLLGYDSKLLQFLMLFFLAINAWMVRYFSESARRWEYDKYLMHFEATGQMKSYAREER